MILLNEIHFIDTKLKMPSGGKNILERGELIQNILKNTSVRVFVINAPGGYGKTILATQIVHALEASCIWYHLDEADNDPVLFFHYLFHSLFDLMNEQDKEATVMLGNMENGKINYFYMASFLLEKVKELKKKVILVLDDLHLLNDAGIFDFLNVILKYLPENLYFIVTTRRSPKLDLVKLITSDLAIELNKDDIRFSFEEFIALININNKANSYNNDSENLKDIYKKSEGWILPLSLCIKMIQRSECNNELIYIKSQEPFFQFFVTQIFEHLLPEEKKFLLYISVLDKMTADACTYISDNSESEKLLKDLADEESILTVHNGIQKFYSCHQLLRDFLIVKLGDKAPELYIKAGDYYYGRECFEEAIEYYIKGKELCKAADSLRYAGIEMIRNGRMKTVERWLSYFDVNNYDKHSGVLLIKAFVTLYKGAFDLSEEYLKQLKDSRLSEEDYSIEKVIESRIMLYRHSLIECINCADLIIINRNKTDSYTVYEAYMNKAYGQVLMGDFDDSVTTLESGKEYMRCHNNNRLSVFLERYLIVPYFMKFEYKKALQYSSLVIDMTDEEINLSERYSLDLFCARLYRDLGRLMDAKNLMDQIIKRKHALGFEEDVFAVYYHYATLLRDMGEFDQALQFASLSEELFISSGSRMEFTQLVKVLKALILSDTGRKKEGLELVCSALSKLLNGSSKFMIEVAYFSAGIVAIRNNLLIKAEEYLKNGFEMAQRTSLKSMVPVCAGLLVHIYIYSDMKKAVEMAEISLVNNAGQDYIQVYLTNQEMDECIALGFIHEIETEFVLQILKRLKQSRLDHILKLLVFFGEDAAADRLLKFVTKNKKSFGKSFEAINLTLFIGDEKYLTNYLKTAEDTKLLREDVPKLIVRCFGSFQLYPYPYDGENIKWRTQKAKELMAYLIHHAGSEIRTEQILADLWPDTDVNKARDIFYTNLAIVRKVMEKCKLKEDLIKVQQGYLLKKDHIICDEWLAEAILKKRNNKNGEIIKLLNKGYLMDFYSDWVIELRNYYINI